MKLQIEIPKELLHFVTVPDTSKKYEVVNYGYGGTYLMESNSKELNAWKVRLPAGKYEVIGAYKDVLFGKENWNQVPTDKNFILRFV